MGKRIISQNRGKGTPTYTAPSHKYRAEVKQIKFEKVRILRAKKSSTSFTILQETGLFS